MNIKLKCQRCTHTWMYTGNNNYNAKCPHCGTSVSINKNKVIVTDTTTSNEVR